MYRIRTSQGVLIAKINQELLDVALKYCKGYRKIKKFDAGRSFMCFIFEEDKVLERQELTLFLWKDSYIELYAV